MDGLNAFFKGVFIGLLMKLIDYFDRLIQIQIHPLVNSLFSKQYLIIFFEKKQFLI